MKNMDQYMGYSGIPMIFQQKKLVKDVYDRMRSRISLHNKGFNT